MTSGTRSGRWPTGILVRQYGICTQTPFLILQVRQAIRKALKDMKPDPGLCDRLAQMGVHLGASDVHSADGGRAREQDTGIESTVPGQVIETPRGPCFVVETRYPLDHLHGCYRLSNLSPNDHPSLPLARLAGNERLSDLRFRSAIFFDIETTGLGTGSGTYAFMIGLGAFDGDEFCLRQYFMRDYHEEAALLDHLSQQMRDGSWWVTFNGRNFDVPVLETRFICSGYPQMPLAHAPHLDLLYPARRLWRKRLGSCALSSLEVHLLGLTRESDVPGWQIPDLYFDYLRYGETQPMRQVFVHNALDILSLVTLTSKANAVLSDPFGEAVEHPEDRYSLGVMYESGRERDLAQRAYEQALQERLPPDLQDDALRRLSFIYKRNGQIERAVRIWETLSRPNNTYAYVELAKYYEHHRRDHQTAASLVREIMAWRELPAGGQCSRPALAHRLSRLHRKLGKGVLPVPRIESYSFGKITVGGQTYTSDLIILPSGVRPEWWRKTGHRLDKDDLHEVIKAKPSVLVIGTGNMGHMQVPQGVLDYLAEHDIRAVMQRTAEACECYNELAQTEQAAAALHLTC